MLKKIILSVFSGLLLISCGVTKKTSRTDKSEGSKVVEERKLYRPGDTLTIDIPNINFKDTTITRVNYENKTVATVRFDKEGNQTIECLSAELKEEFRLMREEFKNDVDDKEEVKREFNPQVFIYALAVLGLIIIILLIVFSIVLTKVKKSIPGLVSESVKKLSN